MARLLKTISRQRHHNFNSPGINFNPENYKAWMRLAKGKGTITHARYLLHEIEEIKQLRKIQQETGFDFMGKDFFKMDDDGRKAWEAEFLGTENSVGHYIKAHSKAVEHEYKFISRRIAKMTKGEVNLNGKDDYLKLILSEPDTGSRQDHLDNVLVYGRTLEDYLDEGVPEYVELAEAVQQPIKLSAHIKRELGLDEPVTLRKLITKAKQTRLNKLKPGM